MFLGNHSPSGEGKVGTSPSQPRAVVSQEKPEGESASQQVAVYWEEEPALARQEVEGGRNNYKHREGWGSRCSSQQAPCGNPWSRTCSLGTVAALAEGVMDMMVRTLLRSQHSNPQAGLGAGEGSQGAVVPAPPLRLLGKGTWGRALARRQAWGGWAGGGTAGERVRHGASPGRASCARAPGRAALPPAPQ